MDCADIERELLQGRDPQGAEVEAHVRACTTCKFLLHEGAPITAALRDGGRGVMTPAIDLAAMQRDVEQALADERGFLASLRATPHWLRAMILLAACGLVVLFNVLVVPRVDLHSYPPGRFALEVGVLVVVIAIGAWHAFRPLHVPPLARWAGRALLAAAVLVPLAIGLAPPEETLPGPAANYVRFGYEYYCFAIGGMVAVAMTYLARFLDRSGHNTLTSALFAAAVGSMTGLLALHVECPINYRFHYIVGHATIPIAIIGATWLLARTRR